MNQEIVITDNLIDYFENNPLTFTNITSKLLVDIIEQNKICDTKNRDIFSSIVKKIDTLSNKNIQQAYFNLFENWLASSRIIECNENNHESIALNSKDCILLDCDLKENQIRKKAIKQPELEFHNDKSFIKPEPSQRLKNLPFELKLEKDIPYDLVKILEPFLRGSGEIILKDPYLYNSKALFNLRNILKNVESREFKIITYSKHYYLNHGGNEKDYHEFEKCIKEFRKVGYKVSIENYKAGGHKERFIKTEKVVITLPGGLDFFDNEGKPNLKYENEEAYLRVDFIKLI
ncbi:MAG: hypothetical protein SCALA702_26280 [Melioribacteraceae bacterium]|nr:MAG: hypothetical protein SCALA702_26280 [Melioribacteraceae bacterium]